MTPFFYHKIIRRASSVFGSLFNNIMIRNVDASGNVIKESKVPLAYGSRDKFLERIKRETDLDTQQRVAVQMPRLSFEITSLTYDADTATSMLKRVSHKVDDSKIPFRTASRTYSPTPYKLGMRLSIMARLQDEVLQILEQILPYFRPDFLVTVKHFDEAETVWDMPITLTSISMNDDYEGNIETNTILTYTLEFDILIRFFGPVSGQGVITKVIANVRETDKPKHHFATIRIEATPTPGSENGYVISESIEEDFYVE